MMHTINMVRQHADDKNNLFVDVTSIILNYETNYAAFNRIMEKLNTISSSRPFIPSTNALSLKLWKFVNV